MDKNSLEDSKIEDDLTLSLLEYDGAPLNQSDLAQPDPVYDKAVRKIYEQTHAHRDKLVWFYIAYTSLFTVAVLGLVTVQATVRIATHDSNFEIMPQWTLDILVTGMFGQFLVLLKIVTESVWDFNALFRHHNEMRSDPKKAEDDKK